MKPSKCLLVLGTAFVVACGGGGNQMTGIDGGGSPAPVATNIVSQGTITGFGSVIVNGVRYDTGSATINLDGSPGVETDLAVGQIVVVKGTISDDGTTGTATSVDFDDAVEGPIESIDLANDSMTVLGQLVLVNGDTVYEDDINPDSLEGLNVGDIVEVSGNIDANGDIVATYIELEDPGSDFEVTGFAMNVDSGAFTFEINSLVVDYSAASLDDFPNGGPENGQLVEAKGNMLGGAGELIATEVEFEGNDFDVDDGDEVEIEGFITRFNSATDFDVSGIAVTTNASTEFENGSSANLALNVKVEVDGEINAAGILVADEVDFEEEGIIRIAALVQDVQSDRLTLLGIEVTVNVQTEFDDESAMDVQNFSFSDVNVGDYVEVRGFDSAGTIVATRLERDDDEGEVSLRGFVEAVADPEFTILGVTIQTNAGTEFEDDDVPLTPVEFFSQAMGRLVEAEGVLLNGAIVAEEVEFEDDD